MIARRLKTLALLLVLLAGTAYAVRVAGEARAELAATELCEDAARGEHLQVIERSRDVDVRDAGGRLALECRCLALMLVGERPRCAQELERALAVDEGWLPDPDLASVVISARAERGDLSGAATLAARARAAHPGSLRIFTLEAQVAAEAGDARAIFAERRRQLLQLGVARGAWHLSLALAAERAGLPEEVAAILEGEPSSSDPGLSRAWFVTKGMALAERKQLEDHAQNTAAWIASGVQSHVAHAHRLYQLSIFNLLPPSEDLALMRQALKAGPHDDDPAAFENLTRRLLTALSVRGETEAAVALLAEARAEFEGFDTTLQDITASARQGLAGPPGTLVFRAGAEAGQLFVSADDDGDPAAPYEAFALAAGARLELRRRQGPRPVRWVFTPSEQHAVDDTSGATRGTGAVWPAAQMAISVDVARGTVGGRPTAPLKQRPADGRLRVFLVVLDGGDWHIVQYGRALGLLPTLGLLHDKGHRAVLTSDPPDTAAAIASIVRPERKQVVTVASWLHQLGAQVATVSGEGSNPLEGLALIAPTDRTLFERLGDGPLVVGNMLLSLGSIEAGAEGSVRGPAAKEGPPLRWPKRRPLSDQERSSLSFSSGADPQLAERWAAETAALFDGAIAEAERGTLDLLALRVDPTDIASHTTFSSFTAGGRSEQLHFLLWLYEYCDQRLGQLLEVLDEDDVLIVASDHGMRSNMAHDESALFLAGGARVPRARTAGAPSLAVLPRVLAELLGVKTEWPTDGERGLVGWARAQRERSLAPQGR